MDQERELDRLEGFVSRLLAGYKALKKENEKLLEQLDSRDEVIKRLQQDLSNVDGERSEINGKITTLIAKIEQWETELTTIEQEPQSSESDFSESESSEKASSESDSSGIQGSLFALNSDTTEVE